MVDRKKLAHQLYQDRQDQILIKDWMGNLLYQGHKDHKGVDKILKTMKCQACKGKDSESCSDCMGTGYSGSFTVEWLEDRSDNVYEHINY